MPLALIIALALLLALTATTATTLLTLRHRQHNITTANTRLREQLTHSSSETSRECPFCGLVCTSFEPFGPEQRPNARCPTCGSLERHRLAWLYLLNETDLLSGIQPRRMLHLAPEVPSWRRLSRAPAIEYLSPDEPGSGLEAFDVTQLPFPDASFDVICCGHAFESAADRELAAREVARVLRPGGWAIVQVPRLPADAAQGPEAIGVIEDVGGARIDSLTRAGLKVTVDPYARRIGPACARRYGLAAQEEIHFARKEAGGGVERLWTGARDLTAPMALPGAAPVFRGRVEGVRDGVVSGWVWRPAAPEYRVRVRMIVDGKDVTGGQAERRRRSLADAGIGDGGYGFRISLPSAVARSGRHRLRVEPEGAVALPAATGFKVAVEGKPDPWRGVRFAVDGFVLGRVEQVRGGVVCGWVWSPEAPDWRMGVRVLVDGRDVGGCLADLRRPSLADAGIGDGRHGFRLRLPAELADAGTHSLRVEAHGFALPAATTFATVAVSSDADSGGVEIATNGFVQGRIEQVREGVVSGWAWNPATPGWRVGVRALVDGQDVGGSAADLYRPSLVDAGIGDGHHGFRIKLPEAMARRGDHSLRIEAGDGARLPPAASFELVSAESASGWEGVRFSLEDPVVGRVERVCDGVVSGWVCRSGEPGWRAAVRVIVDGAEAAEGVADLDHPELARAGLGDGGYGFRIALPPALAKDPSHSLRVEVNGGVRLPASASFVTLTQRRRELWDGVEFHVEDAVVGRVEQASDGIVSGWAYRSAAPAWRVWVRVIVDGVEACSGVADLDRPTLARAGIGDGRHGFRFELPALLPETGRHRVQVQAEGTTLPVTVSFATSPGRDAPVWEGAEFFVDGSESPTTHPAVIGRVLAAHDGLVTGWAYSPAEPGWRVWVRVVVEGQDVGAAVADLEQPALARADIGDGRYGFSVPLAPAPAGVQRPRLRVEAAGGVTLAPVPGMRTGSGAPDDPAYVVEVSPARFR